MVIAPQIMSLEDYFNYEDETGNRYELENGELLTMPPESDLNLRIASFLFAYFAIQGIPSYRLRIGTEIVVTGSKATVRLPDLMVLSEELVIALQSASRSTITMDMPPPQLVIEVVSPGKKIEIEIIVISDRNIKLEESLNIGLLIPLNKKSLYLT